MSNLGVLALIAAAALSRFKVVINSSGEAAYADGADDFPLGITRDGADAAGDIASIEVFGKGETKVGKCSGAISLDALIVPAVDGSGDIKALPTAPGTYWVIGKASLAAGADDEELAFVDCVPYQVTVQATIADASTTATAPVALTYAAPSGGATQDAECRASLAQSAADVAAIRTRQGTVITDIGTLTTKVNAILAALETATPAIVKSA